MAVAELPAAAALLLVAPVGLRLAADRLLVGDARRLQRHLGAEARAQPVDDHLDVDLRQAGDDLLARLLVAVQVDRRVLLLQAAQRGEDLVLVALGLRLHRERHHRLRQLDRRHLDRLVAVGEPVARARLLELGDRADVARAERRRRRCSPCRGNCSSEPDPLLGVRARVEDVAVGPHRALVDAEEVDPPGERVGLRLEDVGEQRRLGVGLQRDLGQLERRRA